MTGVQTCALPISIIKRVVEALRAEFGQIKTFATLSPIPGLRGWVQAHAGELLQAASSRSRQALARQLGAAGKGDKGDVTAEALLKALDGVAALDEKSPLDRAAVCSVGTALRWPARRRD